MLPLPKKLRVQLKAWGCLGLIVLIVGVDVYWLFRYLLTCTFMRGPMDLLLRRALCLNCGPTLLIALLLNLQAITRPRHLWSCIGLFSKGKAIVPNSLCIRSNHLR